MKRQLSLHMSLQEVEHFIQKFRKSFYVMAAKEGTIVTSGSERDALGYTPAELVGKPVGDILSCSLRWEEMWTHSLTEDAQPISCTIKASNGGLFACECSVFTFHILNEPYMLILHEDSRPVSYDATIQEFSRAIMRDVNLGVLVITNDFKLAEISDLACNVFGFDRQTVIGQPLDEVFASVPEQHRFVQRTILDGVVVKNCAVSWTNGEKRFDLLMDSSLLHDLYGNRVGAYVLFKDVSNLRSLEAQVQRSDRLAMIGQIAAGTAHEIRNPLTSIKGFLQVLRKSFQENGMTKEHGYTEVMLTEINRINELVSEFLLLSKPKDVAFKPVNVSAVVREILPIINNEAILHNVTVRYESCLDVPDLIADRELLKQVFLNICKNGIEAMTEGGSLTIVEKVDRHEDRVHVFIHDTGPGIPSFLIDKIFDPFFTTKEEGTGLGLSVCQRIVHDLGGTLRVSSKGYGTTFTVSIPFQRRR